MTDSLVLYYGEHALAEIVGTLRMIRSFSEYTGSRGSTTEKGPSNDFECYVTAKTYKVEVRIPKNQKSGCTLEDVVKFFISKVGLPDSLSAETNYYLFKIGVLEA